MTNARLSAKLDKLIESWKRETAHMSLVFCKVRHPAYLAIIDLSPRVVPLLLRKMRQHPDHYAFALRKLTGCNPASGVDGDAGHLDETARLWVAWGQKQGII